jgi:RNA methyltransferase, TrmH family
MPKLEISSRTNPWFKRFRSAVEEHDTEIVIEGPKQVADAIAAGWKPIAIAGDGPAADGAQQLLFSPPLLKAISETVHHQGTIALFRRPEWGLADIFRDRSTVAVALDGVQDPGNVGTIIRLAAAFEAGGVVLTGDSADPFGPKCIRASAGTILSVPVVNSARQELLDAAQASGYPIFAAAAGAGRLHVPLASALIVFGSEGGGVSPELLQTAETISIPTSDAVESLNVATAAAVVLQRSFELRHAVR